MDFFAHGLWTGALYKTLKMKTGKPFSARRALFWGVFPDLFAFGIPVILVLAELLWGKISVSDLPSPEKIEPPQQNFYPILQIVSTLYTISHSLIIFFAVVAIWTAVLYLKREPSLFRAARAVPWELGGWMFHIILDIPTHSSKFYATPFLWPLSSWKVNGISWGTPWFMALNYSAIILAYLILFRYRKSKSKQEGLSKTPPQK